METKQIYSYFTFCALLTIGYGCSIGGVPNWDLLQIAEVLDTHEGVFEERPTTDIIRVINAVQSDYLNNGPYVDAVLIDSTFVIRTNDNFSRYEEYETAQNFILTITFECAGSNHNLGFLIIVTDTNNNDPIFRPEDVFEFTVMPPLPPGYKITNFLPLTVRDIDLTTQRIDFEIFDSTNFAIAYDDASSTTAKEFRAALSTTTFIRNIPEPIEFTIRATDVDLTGDPRRSRIATVRIISDGSFELPEELVFTQTFYMADLNTENNEIALQEPISLRQGYHHEEVQFSLSTGEHSRYFEIVPNGNSVTLRVTEPIPTAVLSLRKLFLVVRADRQYTSGTSATVILQLPEGINLQFENPIYVGTIEDNALKLSDLGLSQGYENQIVSVEIKSDYATNFGYTIAGNRITLTMSPLDNNTIQQNTFLNLKVVASTPVSSASTVVTLEIIKDDSVTPLFERALYTGTYYINDGLSLEQITLIQGFDDTVEISLSGDHKELFQLVRNGSNSNLVASTLPPELFREQQVLLTIGATKPRTVGATAAISIFLPPETLLEFERLNYMGEITDNVLSVVEDLVLTQGYENEVINVEIQHEHSSYFNYVINENRISLSMTPLDVSIIAGNSFLNLVVVASTSRSSASATVTLDIVKDDTTTPAFERAVYSGYYDPVHGLSIEQITILQGYDNTVEVTLEGDHREYFQLNPTGPNFQITTSSVPAELFPHGSLLLTIAASKPRTVGANAAISISLPAARKLSFSQEAYRGTIQDNNLILGPVTIGTGYADDIELTLSGDYESNFQPTRDQNQISIQLTGQLPESAISENNVLLLTLLASAPHAISTTTTISLEIIKEDTSTPVFNEKIYNVVYSTLTSLEVPDIFLTQGYDENVFFRIAGEHAEHFAITPSGNNVGLSIRSGIPEELIFNEKVLVFNIIADKPLTVGARAAISVSFPSDLTEPTALAFSKNTYTGSLRNDDDLVIENIELNVGFTTDVQFSLNSEYEAYFQVNNSLNTVTISLTNTNTLPPDILNSKFIALELNARRERAVPVTSTVIIDIIQPEAPIPPVFSGAFYRAVYTEENVLQFEREIFLSQGFDNTVSLELEGDYSTWFKVTNNDYVVLITTNGIPESILETNNHLVFAVVAHKTGTITGRATIVVDLPTAETPGVVVLGFTQASFTGRIQNNTLELPPVTLAGIYDMALALKAEGDYAPYFKFTRDSSIINIELSDDFPSEVSSNFIVIDLQISYPDAITGFTTLVIELVKEPEVQIVTPVFEQAYYVGQYSEEEALVFAHSIQLIQGFDETVSFSLEGEDRIYFSLTQITPNSYSLIATDLIQQIDNNRSHLLLSVVAIKPGTVNGEAAIVITLTDVSEGQVLGFERINYLGSLEGDTVNLAPIVLSEGFTSDVQFNLLGDLASFFTPQQNLNTITLTLRDTIPEDLLPSNRLLILQLQATAPQALPAYTTLILEILADEVDPPATIDLVFAETYYIGSYTAADGLSPMPLISLAEGYDESVEFDLEGENAQWFRLDRVENGANLALREPIPSAVLANQHQLVFVVLANRPGSTTSRATIVIQLNNSGQDISVTFDNVLYKGRVQSGVVQHETISLTGYEKDEVDIFGTYGSFFTARHSNELVVVEPTSSLTLPDEIQHVVLELRADDAASVLVLDIVAGVEPPVIPTVSFSSTSYAVRIEMGQTGTVGQVEATADNSERVTYSLRLSNEHLQSRLSVSSEGELRLSAPADIGVYNFEVIATTVFTGATGSATINFAVEAIVICGDDIKTAPLIVVDRDEEEAHRNLIVIDPSEHDGCQYSLTNMWPADHNWLYVDETGLHAHVIDREDPAIAFMALSQIQVELTLHCNTETRTKRSTRMSHDWLGPYDYGSNTWLLGNSIEYNPRRTIVNLIVNDINDNTPKFDHEDLTVGYPVADLASTIAPRALIQLHATDADVGENAAIVYWSPEPQLAVSPLTGLVHIRNDSALIDDMELSVSATDRNGQGLTGTIILTVKLLSTRNIAVLTVDNAFLEAEALILRNLSNALGYEVKSLRSDILPDSDTNQEASSTDSGSRKKREITSTGASLVIHVYGLIESEPVAVERLSNDINENAGLAAYTISSIITLEEHLAGMCTYSGGNIGLLVSTIVLSVLLFLFIVAAVVLFVYVRRKGSIYEKFSDTNSLASKIESPVIEPKPDGGNSLPRLNIEELKRSEKRLQDMLHAPIKEVIVEPSTSTNNSAIIPAADTKIPIIIQDKLKDIDDSDEDEFGERKKGRRKSVVTFNENVEKIIHVEDSPEESIPPEAEYEVYKL